MPPRVEIFVFFGLIASGKSTLAAAWAKEIGAAHYNSDVVRKELAGLLPQSAQRAEFQGGIYTPELSRRTYETLLAKASREIAAGRSVVLDASYHSAALRGQVRELAAQSGCPLLFVQCLCPEDEMKKRMEIRARDPKAVSDGRWEIYLKQKVNFGQPDELGQAELLAITTDKPVDLLVKQLATMVMERR